MIAVCIDIGSTWTKGAAFEVDADAVTIRQRATTPTTVCNLFDGFCSVLRALLPGDALAMCKSGQVELFYSSSAKGGLAVAAIGLVPEITLEIGKIAAQSAGAKLTQVFAYQLTRSDIAALEASPPDILLFAGGTDGGNTHYVLANAEAIGRSAIDCEIVYAGNRAVADDVAALLSNKRLRVVDNLLPSFNEPDPDPARDAIRTVFLETIVKGKGLDRIIDATGAAPVPTPFAMLEYARAIREHVAGWENLLMVDMGGATTDVYSAHLSAPEPGTIVRGMPEPEVKRTVEGDLGLRVSAQSASRANGCATKASLARAGIDRETLIHHANALAARPDFVATTTHDEHLDTLLAGICVGHACARHAGRSSSVFTPEGEVQVQTGRDLRRIDKVIGSGGWLARADAFSPSDWFADHAIDERGRRVLMPQRFDYYRDEDYLFPLLANLARAYPSAAAKAGISRLRAD
ncbi:MAG: glutamate mutase L [Propionivibrio sp.]|nr:glutamate mutase L [Propionivibrio sp.]MBP6709783.1 glutamate mutase L [Propionivibrio sp.]MBP7523193.1 glutamate mutase L [Propionivibrio sp.]MBP8162470.1 glutamate mutase L [Propionivibrio sp.]